MIALDTNVLVRYLTLDEPEQAVRATRVIEQAAESGEPIFVSAIVLCELVWVLDRAYGYRKPDITSALEGLLRAAHLRFADPARLWGALVDFRDGTADFADYLIGREAVDMGASRTLTFDGGLEGADLYELLA